MKVLVTGGGGFLGLSIVKQLLADNHEVTSLSRSYYPSLDELGVKTLTCDLSDKEQVHNLDLTSFDGVIHTAAKAGVWGAKKDYFSINYTGTVELFEKAKLDKIKYFVYTSSPSVVFGKADLCNEDENMAYPKKYYTDYAETKAMAEKYIMENSNESIQVLSLRPHLIWGPNDPHLIPRIIEKSKNARLKQVGDGENLVDVIFVENAANAHILALNAMSEKPQLSKQCYFIGQERPVNLWNFINEILALSKREPVADVISFKVAFFIGHIFEMLFYFFGILKPEPPMTRFVALQLAKNHYFCHDKAKKDFNYSAKITIEEGLKKTFMRPPLL
jgi:nucleoside-diphosphate-sugar epimerase